MRKFFLFILFNIIFIKLVFAEIITLDDRRTVELNEDEKLIFELLKKQSPAELDSIKADSGLSNKKWDKAVKGLRAKDVATVNKTDNGLFVELL